MTAVTGGGEEPGGPSAQGPSAQSSSAQGPSAQGLDDIARQAAELATEVSEADQPALRERVLASFAGAARSGARVSGRGMRKARRGMGTGTDWLAKQTLIMAGRLRVRDAETLREQFPGLPAEDLADALIEGAARASGAIGAAVGAWAVLPVPTAFPVEIVTETLALVGIEVKLVAELHEVYGMPATGNRLDRMTAYLAAWANRSGVFLVPGGLILAARSPLVRRLQRRLAARAGRSAFSLGPLLTGAAAGAILNRRETRRLGQDVNADLRRRAHERDYPGLSR